MDGVVSQTLEPKENIVCTNEADSVNISAQSLSMALKDAEEIKRQLLGARATISQQVGRLDRLIELLNEHLLKT